MPNKQELSNCHHAPARVEGKTTKSYYCNQCNKACDLWLLNKQDPVGYGNPKNVMDEQDRLAILDQLEGKDEL